MTSYYCVKLSAVHNSVTFCSTNSYMNNQNETLVVVPYKIHDSHHNFIYKVTSVVLDSVCQPHIYIYCITNDTK